LTGLCVDHWHSARTDRGDELVLPPLRLPRRAAGALRRAARFRRAEPPLQRGAQLHRGRPAGLQRQPAPVSRWGRADPLGRRSGHLCLVDALINYLSALTYARDGEDLREKFWPHAHHLLARTSSASTASSGPRSCFAAGYEVPQQLFVHGYLLSDDRKISKSLGNVIDPLDLIDVYGSDAVRFWALRSVSFGQDGSASVDALHERYERSSATDLGNLVSGRRRWSPATAGASCPTTERGAESRTRRPAGEARCAFRQLGPDRRARGDLGARALGSPSRREHGPLAARQGRGPSR